MISLFEGGIWLVNGAEVIPDGTDAEKRIMSINGQVPTRDEARKETIASGILRAHDTSRGAGGLNIKFDCLASHDISFVSIVQTAKASGLKQFPIPYVFTNCHNSLCATGGTINEDDHQYGFSAAKKYGGIFVPPHIAVIHSYMREMHAACGRMILGSDSHTRYGALGTMGFGEGGGELAKQLLDRTYDIDSPDVICVHMTGRPQPGVGPQDIALAIIGATFQKKFVKNKVMEFVGDGIAALSADFRNGIDVMTTETACLSSIWQTDKTTEEYYACHGRPECYRELKPGAIAYYDGLIDVDLSKIKPMIALPFHPSNVYAIETLNENLADILREIEQKAKNTLANPEQFRLTDKITKRGLQVDQGVIAGCAGGTFENIFAAAEIIGDRGLGAFPLSVYPGSQPVMLDLMKKGVLEKLIKAGTTIRTAFCGPCFGAGDIPANGQISVRHTTRNFPNREGSLSNDGQIASVALMDARSIAATARNGGILTAASDDIAEYRVPVFYFDKAVYDNRVYDGFQKPDHSVSLIYGPNIADWPEISSLHDNMLLGVASVIMDPVTTTDELIPSGDASSYRSNPFKMAEFTLSRKDPSYVGEAKRFFSMENARLSNGQPSEEMTRIFASLSSLPDFVNVNYQNTELGSLIYAVRPGDGSAREQAASCQRILGGRANIAGEYATKRYRSNLINWGIIPFVMEGVPVFRKGDYIFLPSIRQGIEKGASEISAFAITAGEIRPLKLKIGAMTNEERQILLAGCLINYYR